MKNSKNTEKYKEYKEVNQTHSKSYSLEISIINIWIPEVFS